MTGSMLLLIMIQSVLSSVMAQKEWRWTSLIIDFVGRKMEGKPEKKIAKRMHAIFLQKSTIIVTGCHYFVPKT